MTSHLYPLFALTLLVSGAGCDRNPTGGGEPLPAAHQPPTDPPDPATPDPHAANPHAGSAAADPGEAGGGNAGSVTSGVVQETLDAGSYTYMRVEAGGTSVWVAAMAMPVSVGDHVQFSGMVMTDFHSNTLNRDFDQIIFANSARVVGGEGGSEGAANTGSAAAAPAAPPANAAAPVHGGGGAAPSLPAGHPSVDGPVRQAPPLAPGQTELPPGHPPIGNSATM